MEAVVTVAEPVREIRCPVRFGLQGWGSAELYVERLTIFPVVSAHGERSPKS
jgi:hypothetical protein